MGMYGSSSGGGGETKFEWNEDMRGYMQNLLGEAEQESDRGYQQYQGPRIAGVGDADTQNGMNIVRTLAQQGTPETQGANAMIRDTLAGNYGNPYAEQSTAPGNNEFMGENPYFQAQVQRGLGDITSAYRDATAPQTDAAYVLNGTYGGGDWQKAVDKNQASLGRMLENYSTGMFGQQYDRSAQLREADLGRRMGASQFDKNAGLQSWEQERQRQMGAVPLGFQSQNMAYQGANALMGVGDINRQNNQQNYNLNYQDFQDQQNWQRQNLQWLSGMFSGAMGGLGPNQFTSNTAPSGAMASNILGGALGAYGMFRG